MANEITFTWDIDGYADQIMRVVLDSQTYEMRFQWNERDESWLVYFGDVGSDPTISFKLTAFVDVFKPYQYLENIPSGKLMVVSFTDIKKRVGRYNIGYMSELQMVYVTLEENLDTEDEDA
ncbi:hypothetical protein pEaSNUABM56_00107 [Erwinia phage pEa_SNUABM_56]|uniref:Cyanophage baseplate Pam3 plug gp18 domain-containing protein n=1 Tax=Erwinia phage pEp_SNUABM_01 TaxID=2601643 RepID=A0A5J6DBI6_9CAUD|nr:virion structural protein [Erwinia phage pEp_SNUABM_01]QEQ94906.1 hypothetical protein pEpSNUABM01_080 [Erwinia phage pEp_SNUABM_01]UYL84836.1 hypothetical protein pEaSNUABM55_00038 [Erwinia phage pEa_SNUABM_55]UYL85152.1 hypothetical protein pEaSNUABM56_00107 [Erwinia phage pEa_SNUABM_56]